MIEWMDFLPLGGSVVLPVAFDMSVADPTHV